MAKKKKNNCFFCVKKISLEKNQLLDYATIEGCKILNYGSIRDREQTKNCCKHQRRITRLIKLYRILGMLPNKNTGFGVDVSAGS
jgi:ribosomal protein S18